ncbi:acyl-CoA-binding protein [Pseudomonas sp. N040]|uniref:acyl-CoA-binding protein n=1 Tax=Pseudomonas sp. N040 TaxID=2785325 RepID=UPI0018A2C104|nr:acyl-CoA-binding protein [Pseudomonas sp. N040]MBF7730015.1 acyl-CoA-binding protein [Pseudomonas sp. N040]MBW7013657.1 acyl-CoA-binding protein [Pseudomonas sp. N040]
MSTFEQAQAQIKTLKRRPGNDDMLFLYAHYKQGAAGDVSGARPGMLDMIGRAKYDAWAKLAGLSSSEAQARYVAKVQALLKADG